MFPRVIGSDGAGSVAAAGVAVSKVKPGDAVCLYPFLSCARCDQCANGEEERCGQRSVLAARANGTFAEYVRVPAKNCFPIPRGLTFEEGAAFPLVYLTSWRMLVTRAALKPGECVLVVGCGGIGTAALRIAAQLGAHVIMASRDDKKLMQAGTLGAEQGINCEKTDVAKEVRKLTGKRGVDVVVDCTGGDSWAQSLASLARGGRLVTCGALAGAHPKTDLRRVFWNHLKIFGVSSGTRDEFRQVINFFESTGMKPIIDRIYDLKNAAEALRRLEERKPFGKIVLRTSA